MSEPRGFRPDRRPPTPEHEISPKKKLALLLTVLFSGAGLLMRHFENDNPVESSADTGLNDEDRKQLTDSVRQAGRLMRSLQAESAGVIRSDAEQMEQPLFVSDFSKVAIPKKLLLEFPHQDEPDRAFGNFSVRNDDAYNAQLVQADSDVAAFLNSQIEKLRFDVDNNSMHVYVDGNDDWDRVYTMEQDVDSDGNFLGWFLMTENTGTDLTTAVISSANENGLDVDRVREAVRKDIQTSLLNTYKATDIK